MPHNRRMNLGPRGLTRALLTAASALALAAVTFLPASSSHAAGYREGTLATAAWNTAVSPGALAGVNDWSCTSPGKDPVVLVHATGTNLGANWVKIAPRLKNQGYCVYALNYGMTTLSFGRVGGQGAVANSVGQLADFVTQVRASSGAAKVDLVGHSQGGLVSVAYTKIGGGADVVDDVIALGGSQNGTTLSGLATLASGLGAMGLITAGATALDLPGWTDQAVGSQFLTDLWADPGLPEAPDYTAVMTRYDYVVTPWESGALPGERNVVLQDLCPNNRVSHIGLFLDEPTTQIVANVLAGGPEDFRPTCTGFGPPV